MAAIKKTNAMRKLDTCKIDYEALEYEYDENDLDGHHVADFFGFEYEEVFKTLVTKTDDGEVFVFCLSVDDELDLKKAAVAAGVKKLNMLHVKDLLQTTGYIRGGCSPIGMKKDYPVIIDEMIELVDKVSVSGGQRGLQIRLNSKDLVSVVNAKVTSVTK